MARNPYHKPNRELAVSDLDWTSLKTTVENYLRSNPEKATIKDATIRALDPKLANDRIWNQITAELGL